MRETHFRDKLVNRIMKVMFFFLNNSFELFLKVITSYNSLLIIVLNFNLSLLWDKYKKSFIFKMIMDDYELFLEYFIVLYQH